MKYLNPNFNQRIRSGPLVKQGLPYQEIQDLKKGEILDSFFINPGSTENRVIYIHIPFCNNVCNFCFYHKHKTGDSDIVDNYCKKLISQIKSLAKSNWAGSFPFHSIYFGGGSPTSIPSSQLISIIKTIKQNYPLTENCEITVESTISDINTDYIKALADSGVNRMSLGVQTFQNELRQSLGRNSDLNKIVNTIQLIRDTSISNLCIDLIYNLSGQTSESWEKDLLIASQLPITGTSIYPLISPNARYVQQSEQDLKTEYRYFLEAENILVSREGWTCFTPVQYGDAKSGKASYVSSHGQQADLLAFGSGAGGRFDNLQYRFSPNIEKYIEGKGNFIDDPMDLWEIDNNFQKYKNIYRLSEGMIISKSDYSEIESNFNDITELLIENELALLSETSIELTQTGRFWAANISSMFSNRINELLKQAI